MKQLQLDFIEEPEIWRKIESHPDYEVSNKGRVKSLDRYVEGGNSHQKGIRFWKERILKNIIDNHGYPRAMLYKNKKGFKASIHRLVAEAFIPKPISNEELEVNHISGIKANNNVENLEWVTRRENYCHGLKRISTKKIGASFCKLSQKWSSDIQIKGTHINLGYFDTEKEANESYKEYLKTNNIKNKYA